MTPWLKVAHVAEAHNLPVTSHGVHDLHVHLLAAVPNASYLEVHGFGLERFIAHPLEIRDGEAIAPDRTGHGVEFDWRGLEVSEPAKPIQPCDAVGHCARLGPIWPEVARSGGPLRFVISEPGVGQRRVGRDSRVEEASNDVPIIDPHQHFWDLSLGKHPWLRDEPPPPFRYGDTRTLRRTYLPADYRTRRGTPPGRGHGVRGDRVGSRGSRGRDALGGAARVTRGLPSAVVAQAWLDRDDVEDVLARQAVRPLVRGIRHKPAAAPSPAAVRSARSRLDGRRRVARRVRTAGAPRAVLRPPDAVVAPRARRRRWPARSPTR